MIMINDNQLDFTIIKYERTKKEELFKNQCV